jgi:threonine synthase
MSSNRILCTNCKRDYPSAGVPYRCQICGGLYDYEDPLIIFPGKYNPDRPGIWKYGDTFNFHDGIEPISLGEGNTPLLWSEVFGHMVALKCEQLNPTGSFKDRGSSLIISHLLSRNVKECIEDSSGNAGSSLAAYAARSGIKTSIYMQETVSGIKRKQIEALGASVIQVKGSRSNVSEAARMAADNGMPYASHAFLPFNLPGYATIAYEIFAQLGNRSPGAVIIPVGQGGLLLGISRGFIALQNAGLIENIPKLIGVQARKCSPLYSLFNGGIDGLRFASESDTLAEGVKVWHPVRGDLVLKAIGSSDGRFIAVNEDDILIGVDEFAQRGFHVEPTSALVWSALGECMDDCEEPLVLILTGTGLKFPMIGNHILKN